MQQAASDKLEKILFGDVGTQRHTKKKRRLLSRL